MKKYYWFGFWVFTVAVTSFVWTSYERPQARKISAMPMNSIKYPHGQFVFDLKTSSPMRSPASSGMAEGIMEGVDHNEGKFESMPKGTAMCKVIILENKSSGLYTFTTQLQSFMNGFCTPKSTTVIPIDQTFDPNLKPYIACCDKFYGDYDHIRKESSENDKNKELKEIKELIRIQNEGLQRFKDDVTRAYKKRTKK